MQLDLRLNLWAGWQRVMGLAPGPGTWEAKGNKRIDPGSISTSLPGAPGWTFGPPPRERAGTPPAVESAASPTRLDPEVAPGLTWTHPSGVSGWHG